MDRYELTEGASAKFWQVEVRGTELVVEYGRIGTKGQSTVKAFDSEAAAGAAAAKLVREKTAKGYQRVGTSSAVEAAVTASEPAAAQKAGKAPKAAKAPPVSAGPSDRASLSWISDEALRSIAEKLAKKSKRAPDDVVRAEVGEGTVTHERPGSTVVHKYAATLAVLYDRGLLPTRILGDVAFLITYASDFVDIEKLVDLARNAAYPAFAYDYVCLKIGARAGERIAPENDASFPPAVQRILPFVRRRLGLSTESVAADVADAFIAQFVANGGDYTPWALVDGCIVQRKFNRYDDVRAWAETIGLLDTWDSTVERLAGTSGFCDPWRVLPWLRHAPIERLVSALSSAHSSGDTFLFDILTARKDSADALVDAALAMTPGDPTWDHRGGYRVREAVALVAGAQLRAAGREIPLSLDPFIWFLDTENPDGNNLAYAPLLRAFPRERVLARVLHFLDAPTDAGSSLAHPTRAAVGLGAHFDEALFERYLSEVKWEQANDRAIFAGRLGLDVLPRFEAGYAVAKDPARTALGAAMQAIVVSHARRTGEAFPAEYDALFEPKRCYHKNLWEAALQVLPVERRDAYMLAWAELDPYEWQRNLPLCSDACVDRVIGLMFAMRKTKGVHITYPKQVSFGLVGELLRLVGPQTIPMIKKHFAGNDDAKGRELLDAMELSAKDHAECLGAAGSAPKPEAEPLRADVLSSLTKIAQSLKAQDPVGVLALSTGTILLAESGHAAPKSLGRSSAEKQADVLAYYSERELDGATAGLEALCLRFRDQPVARWEEVLDNGKPILDSNVVGLVIADEHAFDHMEDEDRDGVDELIEENTADGDAVAIHRDSFLAAYVGEVAEEHRLYWGLSEAGAPACLVARFVYG